MANEYKAANEAAPAPCVRGHCVPDFMGGMAFERKQASVPHRRLRSRNRGHDRGRAYRRHRWSATALRAAAYLARTLHLLRRRAVAARGRVADGYGNSHDVRR